MMTRIREIRESRGYDQAEAARLADLYQSNYCKLETGRDKAGPVIRARVSNALGVAEEQLFDGRGWPLEGETAANG